MTIKFSAEELETGLDISALCNGCDELVELAKKDYRKWSELSSRYDGDTESRRTIRDDMIEDYDRGIHYYAGSKYIKIVTGSSVWGFVVKVHDDKKFKFGDILKPAGWKTPARNFARGNVIDKDFRCVHWTSAG